MAIRDFKTAANLFLDTVATFTSYELMDYKSFVKYTVYCSMIALERPVLREKVSLGECFNFYTNLLTLENVRFNKFDARFVLSVRDRICISTKFSAIDFNVDLPFH